MPSEIIDQANELVEQNITMPFSGCVSTATPYRLNIAWNVVRISQCRGALPFPAARRARIARASSS